MIKALRTPDSAFQNLPGYSFQPHYVDDLPGYQDLRVHYLDECPKDSKHTFLCLHGEPTWSYLYRKMVPIFVASGARVIALDFLGFGRSDKPVDENVYSFSFHRNMLLRFIEHLNLKNITLVCQDWGGLLGLTVPMDMPERFNRLLVMNTLLATGDQILGDVFLQWQQWNKDHPDMNIARLMARACPHLTPEECNAYAAPFPDITYKAGVRHFPNLFPDHPKADGAEISRRALAWWKSEWKGSSFMAIGMKDSIIPAKVMHSLNQNIHDCPPPYEVAEAGHFLQEWGEDVAAKAIKYFGE